MLEETADVVRCGGGSVFVVMQVVHCLPTPVSFSKPLTLDFKVGDSRVSWWQRSGVRAEVLSEYQVRG